MSTETSSQHISHRFDEELAAVKTQLFEMGGIVERQVNDAVQALLEVDSELANRVIDGDKQINDMEVTIDEDLSLIHI